MNMRRLKVESRSTSDGSAGVTSDDFRLSTVIESSQGSVGEEDLEVKLPPSGDKSYFY